MDMRVCVCFWNLFARPCIPASRTPATHRASNVIASAMILLEFVPGSGSKCCRFSAFIPIKMEIHDFGLYNCVLDRPVRIVPLREDSVFVPIQHMLVSGSIYGAP